jgi:hypothetical protein
MEKRDSAPLLSRVKAWQLIGLGISGWCTLYSVAILTWGASSFFIGNAQGGCFAATMALAGVEAKRHKKVMIKPVESLEWTGAITTEYLNQSITAILRTREFVIEASKPSEKEMGFGVRGVNSGRTVVFETARWKEPLIDLQHVRNTEENRRNVCANHAVIVSVGSPDEEARAFVQNCPIEFFGGDQLKEMLAGEKPDSEKA